MDGPTEGWMVYEYVRAFFWRICLNVYAHPRYLFSAKLILGRQQVLYKSRGTRLFL